MTQLKISDIIDKHKGEPCFIACHGPSLNQYKRELVSARKEGKILRLSVNNWWDYFENPPDYWILSSSEHAFTVRKVFPILSTTATPLFFSDDGDFTPKSFIEENLKSDWLVYDQRHWEGKDCIQILKQFKKHYEENKDFHFARFGNNEIMWHPPRCFTNSGHALDRRCCAQNVPPRVTLQEELQRLTGATAHYSTGDTVALHAISFAIIMGCNPIYVAGMDLDYNKGYANPEMKDWKTKASGPNDWTPVYKNLQNDIKILNHSAKNIGTRIVNLNKDSWFREFDIGEFVV
jgi:hypothetical protein